MKSGNVSILAFLFLVVNMNLYSQKETLQVSRDTLFFNYDNTYLKKNMTDSNSVYVVEGDNREDAHSRFYFELEELEHIEIGKILDLRKFLHRSEHYNSEFLFYRHQKIFEKFNSNEVIFVDTTSYLEKKFYKASVVIEIE